MKHALSTLTASMMVVLALLLSCEKMVVDENEPESQPAVEKGANLILKVVAAGTRGDAAPWTTLNFVVYQSGSKVKGVTQKVGDASFGEVGMALTPGTYQVMVLAHSSSSNPTLSDPSNIKFTNSDGFSDTFIAYQDVTVEATAKTHEINVVRASAMVRFKTKDVKPAEAKRVRFYYEGGSGAINVLTGYGVDKSKQVVFVDLPDSLTGKTLQFDLYTFPRNDESMLKLLVSMFDENESLITYPGTDEGIRTFTDIPIKKNQITECSGYFFTSGSGEDTGGDDPGNDDNTTHFLVVVNPEWGNVLQYEY